MSRTDKIKQRLLRRFIQVQKAMAEHLNQYVNQKSRFQKTCGLILCCLFFAAWSTALIIGAVREIHPCYSLQRITRPSSIIYRNERSGKEKQDFLQIRKIHAALDSLHLVNPKRYDTLFSHHRTLMDSLSALDSIYQHQNIQQ